MPLVFTRANCWLSNRNTAFASGKTSIIYLGSGFYPIVAFPLPYYSLKYLCARKKRNVCALVCFRFCALRGTIELHRCGFLNATGMVGNENR